MPAPVVGDHAVTLAKEEQHLSIPVIGREWPAMAEDDRLTGSPILVVDFHTAARFHRIHCALRYLVRAAERPCPINTSLSQKRDDPSSQVRLRLPFGVSRQRRRPGCVRDQQKASAKRYFEPVEGSRNWWIIGAITSSLSSRAKCPVSRRCRSALGRSRR